MNTTRNEFLRLDFIQALIKFSNGKISEKEANSIADRKLRLTDFSDGSPLAHKGHRWLAKHIVRTMTFE